MAGLNRNRWQVSSEYAHNLKLGKQMESESENVFYVTIKNLRPKKISRIDKIELSTVAT